MRRPISVTHVHIAAAIAAEVHDRRLGTEDVISILDAGCGDGALLTHLGYVLPPALDSRSIELTGFDVADSGHVIGGFPETTIEALNAEHPTVPWSDRITCTTVDATWPYPDDSFEVVVSNQVIEHVFDIDHFFGEVQRTLKPGGVAIHVFPFRRMIWENHLGMPVVHWARSRDVRRALIRLWTRLGLGRLAAHDEQRGSAAGVVDMSADLLQFACCHRSWTQIAEAAHRARLHASHRYTGEYYLQKALTIAGRVTLDRYQHPSALTEAAAFAVLPFIASGTIVLEKPEDYEPWELTP